MLGLLALLLSAAPTEKLVEQQLSLNLDIFRATILSQTIHEECAKSNIDPLLILAIMKVESSLNPDAISPVGARGLMQIMPVTEKWILESIAIDQIASYVAWDEPISNSRLGIAYFSYLIKRYLGNIRHALVAYNSGPSALDKLLISHEQIPTAYTTLISKRLRELKEIR